MSTSIIDKIRKLRELSKSSNIHEATAAAAAADKLISQHRISEAQIAIANRTADLPAEDDKFILYETGRVTAWKSALASILSKHYGCALWVNCVYNTGRKVSQYRLVGLQSDMEIVRYMFAWLTTEIERLSKANCVGRGHIYAQSYCEGAVNGIRSQLNLMKQEEKNAALSSGQTTALACLDERITKAELAMNTLHKLRSVKTQSHRHVNYNAYDVGTQAGKSIHLGKAMGAGNQGNLLK